jgi:streptogramin lyase
MGCARGRAWGGLVVIAAAGLVFLSASQGVKAQVRKNLLGGPHGTVRSSQGFPLEGIMVQLISHKNSIRTTVYTNETGEYEFPKLENGEYTMRIPRPLEFRHYQKDTVPIQGATQLEDIVLERWADSEYLAPTADILPQLTDSEWVANLPGTGQEKKIFTTACGSGCHSFQMPFRNRFDEQGWRLIVNRMKNYPGRILVEPRRGPENPRLAKDNETIVKWLAQVRGPEAQNPPFKPFPRAQGPATRAIVTEYELPWLGVQIHDVSGDAEGNIWFTINRSPFIGKLDPKTGKVTSYRVPLTPGKHPGEHWIRVDNAGIVWYSETWSESLGRFDPRTGVFKVWHTGVQGNMAMAPDGSLWRTRKGNISHYDRETGLPIKDFPMKKLQNTYGNWVSPDGKYFGGGSGNINDFDSVVFLDIQKGEVREIPTPSGAARALRGSFDRDGNMWVGGAAGVLVKYDHRTGAIAEYVPPTPYTNFYDAVADKNGDIWAGEMQAGRMARFNPRTYQWTEYVLPEPYAFDFSAWVDNSTDPVTVWYGDEYGYIVRIQPLQ